MMGPFTWAGRVLDRIDHVAFDCPVAGESIAWAAKDAFNPGAVVHDGRVCLLVRAEDAVGPYAGTSRIGLATSDDGIRFELEATPVLFPDNDEWRAWEWPGGCEDPRVVEAPDGTYVCTYTAFDGHVGRMFVATSTDLRVWTKHGPAFAGTPYAERSSKSGAVLTELRDGRLVATRYDGRYWMWWGEGDVYGATSEDLVHWKPIEFDANADRILNYNGDSWEIERVPGTAALRPLVSPRRGRFDSLLVEPGPPAVRTDAGIVLLVNGANHPTRGDATAAPFAYQPGQVLFDPLDPTAVIARTPSPFATAPADEVDGQVGNVCFVQGLVAFDGQWRLYVGLADSRIGCFTAPLA